MPSPKTRKKPQIPKILSLQQQSHLLDTLHQAANLRDATLISLVLKTGLKSAEVCALDVADVWQNGQAVMTLKVRSKSGWAEICL